MTRRTGIRRQGIGLLARGFAAIGRVVAALILATMLTNPVEAQDPAVEARDASAGDMNRSGEPAGKLAVGDTKGAGGADLRKAAGASSDRRDGRARKLTMRQKRIFVLGLGAGGKK